MWPGCRDSMPSPLRLSDVNLAGTQPRAKHPDATRPPLGRLTISRYPRGPMLLSLRRSADECSNDPRADHALRASILVTLSDDRTRQRLVLGRQVLGGKLWSRGDCHRPRLAGAQRLARARGARNRPCPHLSRWRSGPRRTPGAGQAGTRANRAAAVGDGRRCGTGPELWDRCGTADARSRTPRRRLCLAFERDVGRGLPAIRALLPSTDGALASAHRRERRWDTGLVRIRAGVSASRPLAARLAGRRHGAALPPYLRRKLCSGRGRAGAGPARPDRAVQRMVPLPDCVEAGSREPALSG